ncbi:MAG: peptidase S41 [Sphingomonas sp.]|nr:peptidase S41 [Sphingomonas sp.]
MMSACGDGGSSTTASSGTGATGAAPTPTPTAGCTLRDRQNWAAGVLNEWYLFPDTLPSNLDPSPYTTVSDYIDALTATARAQHKDRYFTYLTSIATEDAYYNSGSSAGFGVRLTYDTTARRVFVVEAFEGAPALAAGIDRGTEILAVGTSASNLQNVSDLIAASGSQGVVDALGPSTAGTARVLKVVTGGVTSTVTVTKTDYSLTPVSSRYGAKIITDGGQKFGYVNLRTFINTADPALRDAFTTFKAQGITNVIVDLRYNGGGLVSIADLFGDLLGGNRASTDAFEYLTFRPEKTSNNSSHFFTQQPQSIGAMKIAFIGTTGTASASEILINGFVPYLHANAALIGTNTYGKPVGQVAIDKSACDDRLRVIAFAVQNGAHQGAYYDGLAPFMEASCSASDDYTYPLGDAREASVRSALDFLEGKVCSRISSGGISTLSLKAEPQQLVMPDRPSTMQRETPGSF